VFQLRLDTDNTGTGFAQSAWIAATRRRSTAFVHSLPPSAGEFMFFHDKHPQYHCKPDKPDPLYTP
jgi:hypothetical protein